MALIALRSASIALWARSDTRRLALPSSSRGDCSRTTERVAEQIGQAGCSARTADSKSSQGGPCEEWVLLQAWSAQSRLIAHRRSSIELRCLPGTQCQPARRRYRGLDPPALLRPSCADRRFTSRQPDRPQAEHLPVAVHVDRQRRRSSAADSGRHWPWRYLRAVVAGCGPGEGGKQWSSHRRDLQGEHLAQHALREDERRRSPGPVPSTGCALLGQGPAGRLPAGAHGLGRILRSLMCKRRAQTRLSAARVAQP